MAAAGIPVPNNWTKISYFHCSLLGYFLGLLTATVSSEVKKPQIKATIAEKKIHPLLKSYEVKWHFSNGRGRP